MSPDESFCLDLCTAARRCSIYARAESIEAVVRVVFFDVMAQTKIAGDLCGNKKDALISACRKLQDYFNKR